MAGRPTFKCRKIVIEPAAFDFCSISKVINATSMKMKNNSLAIFSFWQKDKVWPHAVPQREQKLRVAVYLLCEN